MGEGEKEKKSKIIYRTSQKNKNNKCFLESLLSESFPTRNHSPPDAFWTCSGGSSDSNLVLLLCVLASNVHSYQS